MPTHTFSFWLRTKGALKIGLVFLVIAVSSFTCLILLFFAWPFPKIARFCRSTIFKFGSKAILFILGITVIVRGKFQKGSFLLVSNHLSYLDVIVYASLIGCQFIAKLDVVNWPFFGKVTALFGTLYINRMQKKDILRVIPLAAKHLEDGSSICFFPEGTSSNGKQVEAFRPSLFQAAVLAKKHAVPASLSYFAASPGISVHDSVCWWQDDLNFMQHLFLLAKNTRVAAKVCISTESYYHTNYKILSQLCREKILDMFVPAQDMDNKELSDLIRRKNKPFEKPDTKKR